MENPGKKKLYHDTVEKRYQIIHLLSETLSNRRGLAFAYLYGSFLEDSPYHDIDVGIYWKHTAMTGIEGNSLDLGGILSAKVQRPVDVRPLNNAPTGFLYYIFQGRLLVDIEEDLRVRLMERTIMHYLDMKPLMRKSLKEAMTR